jgi:hydrogenase expression/formation protein HypC
MCLGLPGRVVALTEGADLGQVEIAGVIRQIDLSLLPELPAPGDYLLVHGGIALERMPPEWAHEVAGWFPASAPEPGPEPFLREEGTQQQ